MRLEALELWVQPVAGPLLPQLRAALAAAGGEPLRWAITAVEQERGLRIEAIRLQGGTPANAASQPR